MAADDGQRLARYLGFAGLIPFYATAVGAVLADDAFLVSLLLQTMLIYAAVIASFLGAVHWGLAMAMPDPPGRIFALSVVPGLLGWAIVGVLSGPETMGAALVLFALLFAWLYLHDRKAVERGQAPQWYGVLRGPLTALVIVALLIGLTAAL